MGTTIHQSERFAIMIALLAICLLIASPFLLLHHSHAESNTHSHCAICALASTSFAAPPADCVTVDDLVALGLHVLQDEPWTSEHVPTANNVRAPPAA